MRYSVDTAMNDWIRSPPTGGYVLPGEETTKHGWTDHLSLSSSTACYATATMALDLMQLFTHRSLLGSNTYFRPDCNHRRVFVPNIIRTAQSGSPGMLVTAMAPTEYNSFHGNKMGLMFYSLHTDDDNDVRERFALESFTDMRAKTTTNMTSVETDHKGPIVLANEAACEVNADDYALLMKYFDVNVETRKDAERLCALVHEIENDQSPEYRRHSRLHP